MHTFFKTHWTKHAISSFFNVTYNSVELLNACTNTHTDAFMPETELVRAIQINVSLIYCCCSFTKSCLTLWQYGLQYVGSFFLHYLLEFAQIYLFWIGVALYLSHPQCLLISLPSIFSSIRVFSNELTLCTRWPKYWSLIFNISTSNEDSGLISFRINWFDLLAVQETLKNLFLYHN